MCEKCVELDIKIGRYQELIFRTTDQMMLEATKDLVARMEAEKIALHPEK